MTARKRRYSVEEVVVMLRELRRLNPERALEIEAVIREAAAQVRQ